MNGSRPGIWSLVAIPAILTLLVTILRLVGELQGWDPQLFGRKAGGGFALVGISWLVPVFGFWFGWRVRRSSKKLVRPGIAAAIYLLAAAVFAGAVFGMIELGLVQMPSEKTPGEEKGIAYLFAAMGTAAVIALFAWPRLTLVLMLYGLLARIPIVAITYLDLALGWDTHYGKPAPGVVPNSTMEAFVALATAQLTFWPFLVTPIFGGLAGCLAAAVAGRNNRS